MKVLIITISDRASNGIYEDLSGKEIEKILTEKFPDVYIKREIVSDSKGEILGAFRQYEIFNYVITSGGTGISPRDLTPELTEEFTDKEVPGISEVLMLESYRETPNAMLSRGFSGIKGKTIFVNFPGSVKAVKLCTKILSEIMVHALEMIEGSGH